MLRHTESVSTDSNPPLVAIVVLNWNGWRATIECLQSLSQISYQNYRVLVVDNGSTDSSELHIRSAFPAVALIQTGLNLGSPGGRNVGIREAMRLGANYILLLDNDVVVEADTVSKLVNSLRRYPRIAAACPLIRFKEAPDSFYFNGGFIDWGAARSPFEPYVALDDTFKTCEWAHGCCLLVATAALRTTGVFDEEYFIYGEEPDLCQRFLRDGYLVGVRLDASAFHEGSGSMKANSAKQDYYALRSMYRFHARYAPLHGISIWRLLHWRGSLLKNSILSKKCLRALLNRNPQALARMWAFIDFSIARFGQSPRFK